jgi:predicted naringenin-chalcone synthase
VKSRSTSVLIHTDAELAVGNLVSQASGDGDYTFQIRRANPQQNASIGRGERGVRELKESLAVLRADLNQHGLDLVFSSDVLETVLTYLSLMHNHFSKAHGTDSSPLELGI